MNSRDLDRDVEGCAQAHQRLLASLDDLTDEQAHRPSLLPGWTVGHVLTHLARNADSLTRLLERADRGEVAHQYDGGEAARAADIEAGAGRPAAELTRDVRSTIWALEQQWATTSATGWAGEGVGLKGPIPMADLPSRRWRETEVHQVDLGLGFTTGGWPAEYVRLDLERLEMVWASRRPMGLTELPEAALRLPVHERLAWLLGRTEVPGLAPAGIF